MTRQPPPPGYPSWSKIEWSLARFKPLWWVYRMVVHVPRWFWHQRRWASSRAPHSLSNHAHVGYSQNGEQGILAEILRRLGDGNRYAVEFGVSTGEECCTRDLMTNHGWSGLLMDGSEVQIATCRKVYAGLPVEIGCHFITRENIASLLADHGVPQTLDLLVVDLDGNDYWVLGSVLERHSPRIIVVEYNAGWPPPMEWVMPYKSDYVWDGSKYFGASLTSLAKLCAAHGYVLVGTDPRGVNAFFVRSNLVGDRFPDCHEPVSHHYAPPSYGRSTFGHAVRRPPKSSR